MLCLSQTTGYAILALACLEHHHGKLVLARDISSCTQVSQPYLLKILNRLVQANLIEGKRGVKGGYRIIKASKEISIFDIASAMNEEMVEDKCLLGLTGCSSDRSCSIHNYWVEKREEIKNRLKAINLKDVVEMERGRGQVRFRCVHVENAKADKP